MNTRDLGAYHVRAEFVGGRGFIMAWETGMRFTRGSDAWHPLDAQMIVPVYEDEQELERNVVYMFTEGNYSCDCNRMLFLARAAQEEDPEAKCGDTIRLERLTLIRPDASEKVLWEGEE